MSRALTKTALLRRRAELALYERVRPSLDLARRQIALALSEEREALRAVEAELADRTRGAARALPMLANAEVPLHGLVHVAAVDRGLANRAGVALPTLPAVRFERADYGLLVRPHWVDRVVVELEALVRLRLHLGVRLERRRLLERALARSVQRVNLFDQVLIPRARADIRRIALAIGDGDRMAIVRAKTAKARHASGAGAGA
jgi:V/A-type H+-transporting ATPase subunit D